MRMWMWGAFAIGGAVVQAYRRFGGNAEQRPEEVVGSLLAIGLFVLIGLVLIAVDVRRLKRGSPNSGPPETGADESLRPKPMPGRQ